jgi:N-acetylmuramoyl-L-alanine amidase
MRTSSALLKSIRLSLAVLLSLFLASCDGTKQSVTEITDTQDLEFKDFKTVIIDAGHGGRDVGAVNSLGSESGYTLNLAQMLRDDLTKYGFKVVMTRESDEFLSLKQRVEIANQQENAIFISLHFNSASRADRSQEGIETFILALPEPSPSDLLDNSTNSSTVQMSQGDLANLTLAAAVHWEVLRSLQQKAKMPISDRGIRRARYNVLSGIKHPAVLIEGGFLSHPTEQGLIHTALYQETMAQAIADAVAVL